MSRATSFLHVRSPNPGGVADYVKVCLDAGVGGGELGLSKLSNERLSGDVLLHYSGYGFAKRGAPWWLLKKLERERSGIKSLGVFFHELYASGPPWGSAFWLSPVQRRIVRRLAELSDYWLTNREGSLAWLRRYAGEKPHVALPIFSNVGEAESCASARRPVIVVFGSAPVRAQTYREAGRALWDWARANRLEIHDVGAPIMAPDLRAALVAAGVREHGRLEVPAVRDLLSQAAYGLVAYPAGYVAKSGIFAAYCAYGACPVLLTKDTAEADGLTAGVQYLPGIPRGPHDPGAARAVGARAFAWYRPHRVEVHWGAIRRLAGGGA